MLAFDLETTGLNNKVHHITVASIYDLDTDTNLVFRFIELDPDHKGMVKYKEGVSDDIEEFLSRLDKAEMLCTFNGIGFDLPFLQAQFKVSNERMTSYVLKTFDIFEYSRRVFNRTFGLNLLLELNGFEVKSGNGMQAVIYAQEGKWEELESYCADDSRLTWEVSQMTRLLIPEGFAYRKRTGNHFDKSKALVMYISPPTLSGTRFSSAIENLVGV
jgi:hypothetical protein